MKTSSRAIKSVGQISISYPALWIEHVKKYPMIHCVGIPMTTKSMIQYMYIILTEYFWEFQRKNALWDTH